MAVPGGADARTLPATELLEDEEHVVHLGHDVLDVALHHLKFTGGTCVPILQ